MFITLVPKVYRWLNKYGDFNWIWLVSSLSWPSKRFNHKLYSTVGAILSWKIYLTAIVLSLINLLIFSCPCNPENYPLKCLISKVSHHLIFSFSVAYLLCTTLCIIGRTIHILIDNVLLMIVITCIRFCKVYILFTYFQ